MGLLRKAFKGYLTKIKMRCEF